MHDYIDFQWSPVPDTALGHTLQPWSNSDFNQQSKSTSTFKFAQLPCSTLSYSQFLVPSSYSTPSHEITDAVEATQQDPSFFGASADNSFQASFASASDLAQLADIHAQVSIANPLARCTIKNPNDFPSYVDLGHFHYDQAFAAKSKAVVLKATSETSGEIVGCAWVELYANRENLNYRVPLCQPGFSLPPCVKKNIYNYIHREVHMGRRKAMKRDWVPHYCKYGILPFTTTDFEGLLSVRARNTTTNVCHTVIRALDVLKTLSLDHQDQVHRTLVSFVSKFKPEYGFFAVYQESEMTSFLNEGWAITGDVPLDLKHCSPDVYWGLKDCPDRYRTLIGLLRSGTGKPQERL